MTKRSRSYAPLVLRGRHRRKRLSDGAILSHSEPSLDLTGIQITESEGHPWPPPKGNTADVGGPFYTTKAYAIFKGGNLSFKKNLSFNPDFQDQYDGPLFPYPTATGTVNGKPIYYPPDLSSSDQDLVVAGTTAIARCKPTNSVADVATAIGELTRDGLPALAGSQTWKNRTDSIRKNAGGEYLNYQFGWQPMISDINNFAEAIVNADAILAQYERDAGKVVRRHYTLPMIQDPIKVTKSTFEQAKFAGEIGTFANEFGSYGTMERVEKTTRSRSFSGAFTYHLPTGYNSRNEMIRLAAQAHVLVDSTPTPETLWNIAPWSWAIDWFTNTGDVISNLSDWAVDGLVMRYGYMTERTVTTVTYNLDKTGLSTDLPQSCAPLTLVRETTKRIRANPFGFGLTDNDLSSFQKSIVVALGLSRGR